MEKSCLSNITTTHYMAIMKDGMIVIFFLTGF